jgi:phosphopantothenoylcysteine synthetase/decarboxylase
MRIALLLVFLCSFSLFCGAAEDTEVKENQKKQTQSQPQTQTQTQTQPEIEVLVTNETIQQGTYSGIKEPLAQVITNQQDWEALWKRHTSVLVPQPPAAKINFDSEAVVAIYAGEKRTGGYRIVLKNVASEQADLVVTYQLTEPPANSFTLQVLSQPFLLLKVQKPPGTIRLVKQ